jgi:hypothetical protein
MGGKIRQEELEDIYVLTIDNKTGSQGGSLLHGRGRELRRHIPIGMLRDGVEAANGDL